MNEKIEIFQVKSFYAKELKKLEQHYEKFLEVNSDYVEKWSRLIDS